MKFLSWTRKFLAVFTMRAYHPFTSFLFLWNPEENGAQRPYDRTIIPVYLRIQDVTSTRVPWRSRKAILILYTILVYDQHSIVLLCTNSVRVWERLNFRSLCSLINVMLLQRSIVDPNRTSEPWVFWENELNLFR